MSPVIPAGVLEPLQSSLCPFPRQQGKKYFKPQKPGTSASAAETPAEWARVHPGGKGNILVVPHVLQGFQEN